ncbi:MAG: hypothetical protein WBF13_06630, partial [Candidatus Zixiibacteriota bacterium]
KIDGVVGTATGLDTKGKLVIKAFTARPDVSGIPAILDSIPVVVEVTGEFIPYICKKRYRPVPIGVSVGNNKDCAAGTNGCVVVIAGRKYMLSNNHVLARKNKAAVGEPIVQPGQYDNLNCKNKIKKDKVAELIDFEPLRFDTTNLMDAAIALFIDTNITCSTLSKFYGSPGPTIINPTLGLRIKKVGRTTCLTKGKVAAVNVTVNVVYSADTVTFDTATFVDQIYTSKNFSKRGDSGSLVVTDDDKNNPVGLLFAGSKTGTVLNPIEPVLRRFSATICPNSEPEADIWLGYVKAKFKINNEYFGRQDGTHLRATGSVSIILDLLCEKSPLVTNRTSLFSKHFRSADWTEPEHVELGIENLAGVLFQSFNVKARESEERVAPILEWDDLPKELRAEVKTSRQEPRKVRNMNCSEAYFIESSDLDLLFGADGAYSIDLSFQFLAPPCITEYDSTYLNDSFTFLGEIGKRVSPDTSFRPYYDIDVFGSSMHARTVATVDSVLSTMEPFKGFTPPTTDKVYRFVESNGHVIMGQCEMKPSYWFHGPISFEWLLVKIPYEDVERWFVPIFHKLFAKSSHQGRIQRDDSWLSIHKSFENELRKRANFLRRIAQVSK